MEPWGKVFRALGQGDRMPANELMKMMDMSGVSGELSAAYIDPQLRTELDNRSVKEQIQKLSNDPGMLMKAVQQDPMVQQLAAMNPAMSQVINSPSALKKILSPDLIEKVQQGQIPDDETMKAILDSAAGVGKSLDTKPSNMTVAPPASPASLLLEDGLRLKQVRAGDAKTFPRLGDVVSVQYAGYLMDGKLFDHGKFAFELGASQVIRGWEVALKHMSLGERAALHIPAALAYGDAGKGPIPPGADLVFDVDLRGINQLEAPALAVV